MALPKNSYSFKDRTWYIVPWTKIDPTIPDLNEMPSFLVHDVNGNTPHRMTLWSYSDLENKKHWCYNCKCSPSKNIQALWILENMDNATFYQRS